MTISPVHYTDLHTKAPPSKRVTLETISQMPKPIKTTSKSSPSPQFLEQFTLFATLPVELRLKIWSFCYGLQLPRVVTILTQQNHKCISHTRKGNPYCPRFDPRPQPVLVNTCHESRSAARFEALKAGHLIFTHISSPNSGVFFRPEQDILSFPSPLSPALAERLRAPTGAWTQLQRQHAQMCHNSVRYLALGLERYGSQFNPLRLALQDFPSLEELMFVVPATGPRLLSRGRVSYPAWILNHELDKQKLTDELQKNLKLFQIVWLRRTMGIEGLEPDVELHGLLSRSEVQGEITVKVQGPDGQREVIKVWPRVSLVFITPEGRGLGMMGEKLWA